MSNHGFIYHIDIIHAEVYLRPVARFPFQNVEDAFTMEHATADRCEWCPITIHEPRSGETNNEERERFVA